MLSIDPKTTPTPDLHQFLLGSVAPRPIAFVSTLSKEGAPNLAPYSFFNVFSSNPPIAIFSSNRRVRNNTTKDTLANAEETKEVVINMVSYDIVRQMTLASIEYPSAVNEFQKAGLTPLPSERVAPFRVKESPAQLECIVKEILPLGDQGGAGNLVVCEVVMMHVMEEAVENGRINPHKMDLMGRMGRAFYCRASGEAVFPIVQPVNQLGIGYDNLPAAVRGSQVLNGWELSQLAAVTELPTEIEVENIRKDARVMDALAGNDQERTDHLHRYAKELLAKDDVHKAWQVILNDI
ncbi:MAG: flavin reductase family protein [Bacteroidota bacterium]